MANFVAARVYERWGHLLNLEGSPLDVPTLQRFAMSVQAKYPVFTKCWGFIDSTFISTCRPVRGQQFVYNGYYQAHGMKFQAVTLPNGFCAALDYPRLGRHHDGHVFTLLMLLPILRSRCEDGSGIPYFLIGDTAYPNCPYIYRELQVAQPVPRVIAFNRALVSVRLAVEHFFGKLRRLFAFINYYRNLRLLGQPVALYVSVAAIFTILHSCFYGNQTEDFFRCGRPTLQAYLAADGQRLI